MLVEEVHAHFQPSSPRDAANPPHRIPRIVQLSNFNSLPWPSYTLSLTLGRHLEAQLQCEATRSRPSVLPRKCHGARFTDGERGILRMMVKLRSSSMLRRAARACSSRGPFEPTFQCDSTHTRSPSHVPPSTCRDHHFLSLAIGSIQSQTQVRPVDEIGHQLRGYADVVSADNQNSTSSSDAHRSNQTDEEDDLIFVTIEHNPVLLCEGQSNLFIHDGENQ